MMNGFLLGLPCSLLFVLVIGGLLALGFRRSSLWITSVFILALALGLGLPKVLLYIFGAVLVVLNLKPLRLVLLSAPIMKLMKSMNIMPVISNTEREALEAGSIWVDGELFSGRPDFNRILREPYGKLSKKEDDFIKNQVRTLCSMVDEHEAWKEGDLSEDVWTYLCKERFFGLIIPEEFGGRGFSALGHSEVIAYLNSRSIPAAITVMVPNSLGPAELLIHYGTDSQKNYYLPRLANGQDIPCFALTEEGAGSDAGSISSSGEVFLNEKGEIAIKLNWKKRYITLGAISTVIGLAVKLRDKGNLLGKGEEPGITCLLVPSATAGVKLGRRHDPLGVPFYNCPVEGEDVIVSVDQVIGGPKMAGQGWRMLMECLAAGRAISLPASSTGGSKRAARVVGAYAKVRKQFGISIGKFEGISEILGRIGASTYLLEASRKFTVGAVDSGLKPAVVSAIAKFTSTEISRKLVIDSMDLVGGSGISKGPRNLLAGWYTAAPIGITVEGSNVLTRTMIIFGQGAIRCHPYAYKEVKALQEGNVSAFDEAFWGHIGHVFSNKSRAIVLTLTRGRLASVPDSPMAPHYRKIAWVSSSFAFLSDVAMGSLGGTLKFRESITGRFADILSWMYLLTAALRRYEAEGRVKEHEAFVHYIANQGFNEIQKAFDGIYQNLKVPFLGWLFRGPIALWSRFNTLACPLPDRLAEEIAKVLMTPGALRDSITDGIYLPTDENEALGRLEKAMLLAEESEMIVRKINKGIKDGVISKGRAHDKAEEAVTKGLLSQAELIKLNEATLLAGDAIKVDAFKLEDYGRVNAFSRKI